jgi:hypothetical protein
VQLGTVTTVSGSAYVGEWLQLQLPVPGILRAFTIYCMTINPAANPRVFCIAGSNDSGATWSTVHNQTDTVAYASGANMVSLSANTTAYKTYRLCVNSLQGTAGYWACDELVLLSSTYV